MACPAARSPLICTSSVMGVSGPGSESASPVALNTGKRGSIRSSNSPSRPPAEPSRGNVSNGSGS